MLFDPRVIESLITRINPLLKVEAHFAQGRRKILAFRFVRGLEGGVIRHVLVRIEDLTREEELARELEAQRQRGEQHLELAVTLMQTDPEALVGLLNRMDSQLRHAEALCGPHSAAPAPAAFNALLRDLHGSKGEAGLLGFSALAREVHHLEDALAAVHRGKPEASSTVATRTAAVAALLTAARSVLGQLTRLGRAALGGGLPPSPSSQPSPQREGERRPEEALRRFVAELGTELGKPARFLWRFDGMVLPDQYLPVVREAVVQLARNSLVHGVEAPDVRRLRGKPAVATLQLAARRRPGTGAIELIFQDDGAGLDLAALRPRAGPRGRAAGGAQG